MFADVPQVTLYNPLFSLQQTCSFYIVLIQSVYFNFLSLYIDIHTRSERHNNESIYIYIYTCNLKKMLNGAQIHIYVPIFCTNDTCATCHECVWIVCLYSLCVWIIYICLHAIDFPHLFFFICTFFFFFFLFIYLLFPFIYIYLARLGKLWIYKSLVVIEI